MIRSVCNGSKENFDCSFHGWCQLMVLWNWKGGRVSVWISDVKRAW